MNKKYLISKIKRLLGFVTVLLIIPTTIFAIYQINNIEESRSTHNPTEIETGNFQGEYKFNGSINSKEDISVKKLLSTKEINAFNENLNIEGDIIIKSDNEEVLNSEKGTHIIEEGSNGDEYWQKFSDGTMNIYGIIELDYTSDHETGDSCSISDSDGFWWGTTHTFPIEFKEQPIVIISQFNLGYHDAAGTGEYFSSTNVGDVTNEEVFFHACDHSGGSTGAAFVYQAVGKWK